MKKLLESMTKFAGEPEQKKGDQVRGTDNPKKSGNKHGFEGRLVGEDAEYLSLVESLLQEYKYFVEEPAVAPGTTATSTSPVANINPASTGNPAMQQQVKPPQGNMSQNPQAQIDQAKQQLNPQQQAQLAQSTKTNTNTNLNSVVKKIAPNLNVQKATDAFAKDPAKLNPADQAELAKVALSMEPALTGTSGMAQNAKSLVQKAGMQQQQQLAKLQQK